MPFGLIFNFDVRSRRNILLQLIFEKFFAGGIILVGALCADIKGLQAGIGDRDFTFQGPFRRQFQIGFAANLGISARREVSGHPNAAVTRELAPGYARFEPRENSKGSVSIPRVKIAFFTIEDHEDDVGVEFGAVHHVGPEEILTAAGNNDGVSLETGGTGQTQKKPVNIPAVGVAVFPDVLNILVDS